MNQAASGPAGDGAKMALLDALDAQSFPAPPPEPDMEALAEEWRNAAEEAGQKEDAADFLAHPAGRAFLGLIMLRSPHLARLAVKQVSWLLEIGRLPPQEAWERTLNDPALEREYAGEAELMRVLRVFKQRCALLIALLDLAGYWNLTRTTRSLTACAEKALQRTMAWILAEAGAKGLLPSSTDYPPENCGFCVIAMGKLGSHELNYSSDVDLMFIYDPERLAYRGPQTLLRFTQQMVQNLVHIMQERTADGYVFRVDLRVRPDPSSMPSAIALKTALRYYETVGQHWERAALIRARPVAGDRALGQRFLGMLKGYIWPKALDYSTLRDILSLKRQIDHRHGHALETPEEYNIKLGRGGIREIEFFSQIQQLVWGGRKPDLRAPGILAALTALMAERHISCVTATALQEAYVFLRQLEHRLQMVEDQQTHSLPAHAEALESLARFAGFADSADMTEHLRSHLDTVHRHFAALYPELPALSLHGNLVFTGTEDDPDTLLTLHRLGFRNPPVISRSIREWHHGRRRAVRTRQARQYLTEIVPALLDALAATPHPNQAFLRFDRLLSSLPSSIQIFSLFSANPSLLKLVADVLGTSPWLADIFTRNPSLIESVIGTGFYRTLPDRRQQEMLLETRLARMTQSDTQFHAIIHNQQERFFQAGVHLMRQISDAPRISHFLSDTTDLTIDQLVRWVWEEFRGRRGEVPGAAFAVLAMGKLGSRELTVGSDLDLVFIYEAPEEATHADGMGKLTVSEYFARLSRRLITALTTRTASGPMYDIDLRLRPSGNAGPLCCSFAAFQQYYRQSAWLWERMALTRARVISAPEEFAARITGCVRESLCQPCDAEELAAHICDMRARIASSHHARSLWDIKYVRGGVVDLEFLVQYYLLLLAPENPELLQAENMAESLDALKAAGALPEGLYATAREAICLYRTLEHWIRLNENPDIGDRENWSDGMKQLVLSLTGEEDVTALEERLMHYQVTVYQHFYEVLEKQEGHFLPPPE